MFIASILRTRFVVAAALALVIATAAYGFAASNTVASSQAGSGAGTISGYFTDNVTYTMNASDPTKIDSVTFDLFESDHTTNAPNTTTVKAEMLDNGSTVSGSIYNCAANTLPSWTCTPSSTKASTSAVESLRVTAHD